MSSPQDDAAKTAETYGRVCALTGILLPIIENTCVVKKKRIDVSAVFYQAEEIVHIKIECSLFSIRFLIIAAAILIKMRKRLKKNKEVKAVQS